MNDSLPHGASRLHALIDILRRWSARIVLSTADQGVSSGANFVMSLFLARWLSSAEHGAYAVGFSVYLFLLSIYNEIVTESMSVFAHAQYPHQARGYFKALIRVHLLTTAGVVALLALALPWLFWSNREVAWALVGVASSLPFSFFYWFCRRACYLNSDAAGAAQGSAVYAAVALLVFFALGSHRLSSTGAYLVVGAGGLVASLFLNARLSARLRDEDQAAPAPKLAEVLRHHLGYARYTLPASVAQALGALAIVPALAAAGGLSAVGTLRAAQNMTVPIIQVQSAITILMLPWMSRRYAEAGAPALLRTTLRACVLLFALGAPYALLVAGFGHQLFAFAYGQRSYVHADWLLYWLLPAAILGAISGPASSALRAAQAPGGVLGVKVAAALVTCLAGVPLIMAKGLAGAGAAQVLLALAEAAAASWLLLSMLRSRAS